MTPVEAVLAGLYDAGVVSEKRFGQVASEQQLVPLCRFTDTGDFLVARSELPEETPKLFRRALTSWNSSDAAQAASNGGIRFQTATEKDLEPMLRHLAAENAFNP